MKFVFGDIVVVDGNLIGVIVKSWGMDNHGHEPYHEVYVRNYRIIKKYPNSQIQRFLVRHKELDEEDLEYQQNAELEP